MTLALTISGVPAVAVENIDLAAVARALRPLLAPALTGVAELAGLGPVAPVLVSIAVKAALVSRPAAATTPLPS